MKQIRILLSAAALCITMAVSSQALDHNRFANYARYAESNRAIAADTVRPKAVFMGNSITQFWAEKHPSFFADNGFVGRGISGQTSFQMLQRFREDVVKLRPQYVVICCGTNDIGENTGPYDEELTMGNIASMAEIASGNNIRVVLASCLPAASIYWRPSVSGSMDKIRALNERIRQYAEDNGIEYVDYFTALLSDDGTGLAERYATDPVHPNNAAYDVMESLILPSLP